MKAQKLRGREEILSARIAPILVFATLLLSTPLAKAVPIDKIFTSSGQIIDGEEWNNVYIYNDDTIVDMLGGDVDGIGTYDASTVNVSGGHVNTLATLEFSTANVSDGFVYGLIASDHSIVNLFGNADLFAPLVRNFGTLNMTGGTVDHLGAIDSGIINLYGGIISDRLISSDSSVVNIYGYDLLKTNTGGKYDYGQVSGFWADGTSFTIDLNGFETYSHINLIPEPYSLILLGLGGLILRRRR